MISPAIFFYRCTACVFYQRQTLPRVFQTEKLDNLIGVTILHYEVCMDSRSCDNTYFPRLAYFRDEYSRSGTDGLVKADQKIVCSHQDEYDSLSSNASAILQ